MVRVLAAVDGSPVSADVLRSAVVMAEVLDAQAEAVFVGGPPRLQLEQLAAATGVSLNHRSGIAADVLPCVLREPDLLLACVGAAGSGGTTGVLGQTALAVLSGADRPVLVVTPGSFPIGRRRLQRALVPLDGDRMSAETVEPVVELLEKAGVEVVVVHVFGDTTAPRFWDQPQHATHAWEREFLHGNLPLRQPRMHLCQGEVADQVLRMASAEGSDVLVVAWSADMSEGHARTVRDLIVGDGVPMLLVPVHASDPADIDLTAARLPGPNAGIGD